MNDFSDVDMQKLRTTSYVGLRAAVYIDALRREVAVLVSALDAASEYANAEVFAGRIDRLEQENDALRGELGDAYRDLQSIERELDDAQRTACECQW